MELTLSCKKYIVQADFLLDNKYFFEREIKNEVLHMLMERGDMDLDKFLRTNRNLEQDQIKDLWRQMLNAVNTIHKRGIIHTDLKPANFLFVDSALKLIDFGIAKGIQVGLVIFPHFPIFWHQNHNLSFFRLFGRIHLKGDHHGNKDI